MALGSVAGGTSERALQANVKVVVGATAAVCPTITQSAKSTKYIAVSWYADTTLEDSMSGKRTKKGAPLDALQTDIAPEPLPRLQQPWALPRLAAVVRKAVAHGAPGAARMAGCAQVDIGSVEFWMGRVTACQVDGPRNRPGC